MMNSMNLTELKILCKNCLKREPMPNTPYCLECHEELEDRNTNQVMDEIEKERVRRDGYPGVKSCIWGKYY